MKKAPIAVALVLVFGLFAAAFSLAPAVAQYTPPSDSTATSSTNSTSSSDTTTSTTTNTTEGDTFSASGSIATLIFDMGETTTTSEVQDTTTASNDTSMNGNATTSGNTSAMMPQVMTGDNATSSGNMTSTNNITSSNNATTSTTSNETSTVAEVELPYIVSGEWTLDVQNGNVSDFSASFTMVHTDGTGRHTHDMSNFVSSNSSTIDTSADGTSFIFGTVDVATDGEARWTGADALIIIEKNNVVSISLATEDTEDHFGGQPIYGIVESMTDENGNELVEGATETADNITQGAENAANETGEFLGNVTEGIRDFFNGTGQ